MWDLWQNFFFAPIISRSIWGFTRESGFTNVLNVRKQLLIAPLWEATWRLASRNNCNIAVLLVDKCFYSSAIWWGTRRVRRRKLDSESLSSILGLVSNEGMDETTSRPYPDCGVKFPSVKTLRNHRKTLHSGLVIFKCSLCSKSRRNKSDLKNHMMGNSDKRKKCETCHKMFWIKSFSWSIPGLIATQKLKDSQRYNWIKTSQHKF